LRSYWPPSQLPATACPQNPHWMIRSHTDHRGASVAPGQSAFKARLDGACWGAAAARAPPTINPSTQAQATDNALRLVPDENKAQGQKASLFSRVMSIVERRVRSSLLRPWYWVNHVVEAPFRLVRQGQNFASIPTPAGWSGKGAGRLTT